MVEPLLPSILRLLKPGVEAVLAGDDRDDYGADANDREENVDGRGNREGIREQGRMMDENIDIHAMMYQSFM